MLGLASFCYPNQCFFCKKSRITSPSQIGGLFFAPTFIFSLLSLLPSFYLAAIAILPAVIISLLDDFYDLPVVIRLPVHFFSIGLMIIAIQPSWSVEIWLLALILLTGWINTFNFMDGINGISVVYAGAMVLTFMFLLPSSVHGTDENISIHGYIFMALLAFAFFNFRKKALCFAGDVGSISLALIMVWFFLNTWTGAHSIFLLLLPLVYAVDSVMTILIRLYKKENIFQAHRTHLYQILANEKGWDHRIVSLLYGMLQLLFNLIAIYWVASYPATAQLMIVASIYLSSCMLYLIIKHSLSSILSA